MRYTRQQVLDQLKQQITQGRPIVSAGAGTGISARCAEAGGADLIFVYNSGRFRMAGHGSTAGLLAYGDANQIVKEMGERDILPVVKKVPVIAGVMGTDPMRQMDYFLKEIDALGFSGINNFPTVGAIDGRLRYRLEKIGLGFGKEVEMIRLARAMGFFTCVYVFSPDEARDMTKAGADAVVAHLGLTVGGDLGFKPEETTPLEDAPAEVQIIGEAAFRVNPEVILLCHGGPISTPEDAAYVLQHSDAVGFVGASSMERLPVERAITSTVKGFKDISIKKEEKGRASILA